MADAFAASISVATDSRGAPCALYPSRPSITRSAARSRSPFWEASWTIAVSAVLNSTDGHTLLYTNGGPLTSNLVSHAGSYLLVELADRVGLTSALSRELACLQRRRRAR